MTLGSNFEQMAFRMKRGLTGRVAFELLPIVRPILVTVTLGFVAGQSGALAAGKVEYNRDVRPILSENCFPCHGPDSAARKAGLRLDRFEEAIAPRKDSEPAIVPGKVEGSELVRRITASNPDDVMPPAKTRKTLTAQQKELLEKWIGEGAKYQQHWSLIPPQRPAVPKVRNRRWVGNPIDNFVFARLEQEGLTPAPEADRRTLARRVCLDLTGLPPTWAQVEAFVNDPSADAYEKLVDRLLASPHYGEHRARYWLDGARYADSNGIHFDNYREMWTYRDWVINAFNRNESFDQFTIEQLAGDLLPNATMEQKIGSGFNRCNITSNEGGAIDEEYLVLYARDRTEATSQVWLGLTAGCAVCHDHKFDPLSQKEFYSMSAFFNNTTQKAMDGNIKDTPPVLVVPKPEDRARWDALPALISPAKQRVEERRKSGKEDFEVWLGGATPELFAKGAVSDQPLFQARLDDDQEQSIKISVTNETREIALATNATWQEGVVAAKAYTTGSKHTPEIADAGDFERDKAFSYAAWVRLGAGREGALFARMDDQHDFRGWDLWLQNGRPGTHIIHKWPDDALKVVSKKALETNRWTHVCVTYDGMSKAKGVKIYIDGELQQNQVEADKLKETIRTEVPFKIGQRHTSSQVEGAGLQDLRIYGRALKPAEVKRIGSDARLSWILARGAEHRTEAEKDDLYNAWLNRFDHEFKDATSTVAGLEKESAAIKMRGTVAHVMSEREESPLAYVLFRGEYDKRRDKVPPATPAVLPPMPQELPRNRLGFARWLMEPEQPLTARVTVNRFWQEVFGTGIVRTAGDFGVTGGGIL